MTKRTISSLARACPSGSDSRRAIIDNARSLRSSLGRRIRSKADAIMTRTNDAVPRSRLRNVNVSFVLTFAVVIAVCSGCNRRADPKPSPEKELSGTTAGIGYKPVMLDFRPITRGLTGAPFATRSSRDDMPRFESLPVDQTGIDFAHNWKPPADYKLEIYNSLPGGGVCIGDYDGDDLPDVFLTQANVGCKLYRNLGDMRFEDVTESVGIVTDDKGRGASFVDTDNDGDLDLYLCNDQQSNQLFTNDGKGKFHDIASAAGVDFSGASVTAAFADYDRDGDLDLYLVTNRKEPQHEVTTPRRLGDGSFNIADEDREYLDVIVSKDGRTRVVKAGQFDHLYRNRGDGTFDDVSAEAGLVGCYFGLSATWFDYDGDGWIDLYVSNDFYSPDQLYRNNGDGTFSDVAPIAFPHTPWYSMGTDAADINNDGMMDLMSSDMSATNHYKQKASMGDMGTTGWFLVHPTPGQYMRNALYLNTGTERFMEIASLAGVSDTDWTWSLKFGDFDEDGWIDLYVTNGMNRDWTNSDLRNLSNAAATDEEKMRIWLNSPQRRDPNLVFRNTGDLRFDSVDRDWGLGENRVSYGAALADLDRDGDLDMVVNNAEEAPSVYRNQTANSRRVLIRLDGASNNRRGIGSRIAIETEAGEQIRELTTAQGYMASNEPLIHFGLGDAKRIKRLTVKWPNGMLQQFEDVPTNHYLVISEQAGELTEPAAKPSTIFTSTNAFAAVRHSEIPFDDYARQPLLPNRHSQLGPSVACGDVDGDGDVDAYVGGASGQAGSLLINDSGKFSVRAEGPWETDASYEDLGSTLFDADVDGDLDLYVVSGGVECEANDDVLQDRLYLNDGAGQFTAATTDRLPEIRDSGGVVAPSDFDGDGDLDLFVGGRIIPGQYPISPKSLLLRNDGGNFVDVTDEIAPNLGRAGLVTDACWADSDGDGSDDLVLALEWGSVRVFKNANGRLLDVTETSGIASNVGWYQSISAGDFDGDGDLDLAVGNWGLNTKYHASADQPSLLYYGDFENEGRMRLVEAEFEDEKLYPVRGKSCSTNAMPFLGNKFERFHDFAVASLEDIYTETRLESAHRFAATTLESGVLRNDGTGSFEFIAFPAIAQVAPICGITVGDFNDDGKLDLFLAENFFGPQPETGRADGGISQILIGYGDCTFTPSMANESGIIVIGDATRAMQADLTGDGVPEVIVPTNDGRVYTFTRRSVSSP